MPAPDLTLLKHAAEVAGDIALRHWQKSPKVWDKPGGAGPVTEADLEVDAALRDMLTAARPDYGWLSEETEDDADRLTRDTVFIVDPIDGTRAFIEGNRGFSHALTVVQNGQPVVGVVYLPAQDKMYAARLGQGATLNDRPLVASPHKGAAGAQILMAKLHLDPKHWAGTAPPLTRHFRPSLAYRMALVGEGRFDGMLTLRDSWDWDVAAGTLLAQEAGAVVTDRLGRPMTFNTRRAKNAGVIAAPPGLHADLLDRLTPAPDLILPNP